MFTSKIAAVGDLDTVSLFQSMGVRVYVVDDNPESREVFSRVLREGYAIIFLTERLGEKWSDILKQVELDWSPTVVLIPDQKGSTGYALRRIREIVKRAIGADLLKEKHNA